MTAAQEPEWNVVVSVATYQRQDLLQALISSLVAAYEFYPFRLCVVDNAPEAQGLPEMSEAPFEIEYVHEPQPGIAAARNAGLSRLRPSDTHVMFVDDDERVSPDWLLRQVELMRELDTDVVSGFVVSVFADDSPRWIVEGGFIQRQQYASGLTTRLPATNNTLVKIEALRRLESPWFDEAFSVTGGSDGELFYRMRAANATIAWCNESVVCEDVPPDRATLPWVWRRMVRNGVGDGRLRLRTQPRGELWRKALVRVPYGALAVLWDLVRTGRLQRESVRHLTLGLGWIRALRSKYIREYER